MSNADKVRRGRERTCPACDELIPPTVNANKVYCSDACRNAAGVVKTYGIEVSAFREMLAGQGGACAGCGVKYRHQLPAADGWHIDHDHETGMVRGILCRHCNLMLGFAKDNPTTLRRAAEYLERTKSPQPT